MILLPSPAPRRVGDTTTDSTSACFLSWASLWIRACAARNHPAVSALPEHFLFFVSLCVRERARVRVRACADACVCARESERVFVCEKMTEGRRNRDRERNGEKEQAHIDSRYCCVMCVEGRAKAWMNYEEAFCSLYSVCNEARKRHGSPFMAKKALTTHTRSSPRGQEMCIPPLPNSEITTRTPFDTTGLPYLLLDIAVLFHCCSFVVNS